MLPPSSVRSVSQSVSVGGRTKGLCVCKLTLVWFLTPRREIMRADCTQVSQVKLGRCELIRSQCRPATHGQHLRQNEKGGRERRRKPGPGPESDLN